MATINHKKYDEATETFKDFNVYDGKETLIFKVDGEGQKTEFEKPVSFAGGLEGFVSNDQPAIYRAFSTTGSYPFNRYGDLVIQARSSHDRNIVFAAGTSPAVIASMTSDGLCFGSDTAAANALDDYEEGTWTPTFFGSSTAGTYTTTGLFARYTKIGRQVTAYFIANFSAASGGSGYMVISGLPFNYATGSGGVVGTIYSSNLNYTADYLSIIPETSGSSNNIIIGESTSGGAAFVQATDFTTSTNIRIQVTYFV